MTLPDLYLASQSPRRRELLTQAGLTFELVAPGAEYDAAGGEHRSEAGEPTELAKRRAERKARGAVADAVVGGRGGVPILAVDTVVDLDGVELGKPVDRGAAERSLRQLMGRSHRVHTAHYMLWRGADGGEGAAYELASATVRCAQPPAQELERYLDSGAWRGKAGAYGIQDEAQQFLELVDGSFDAVVGLHVAAVRRMLARSRSQ
ncbi:MAG: nucleoside triphosphate pyrophosphatase [Planctomycetota bacterium]